MSNYSQTTGWTDTSVVRKLHNVSDLVTILPAVYQLSCFVLCLHLFWLLFHKWADLFFAAGHVHDSIVSVCSWRQEELCTVLYDLLVLKWQITTPQLRKPLMRFHIFIKTWTILVTCFKLFAGEFQTHLLQCGSNIFIHLIFKNWRKRQDFEHRGV